MKVQCISNAKSADCIEQESGKNIHFHYSAIQGEGFKTLTEGQQVEFEVTQGPKGLQATRVNKV